MGAVQEIEWKNEGGGNAQIWGCIYMKVEVGCGRGGA